MIEQDLAVLARLRDAALAVAEAVAAHVEAGARGPAPSTSTEEPSPSPAAAPLFTGDPILAMARAARAVRMTVALRLRMIDDLERLDEVQGRRAASRGVELRAERKAQIARLLTRIIHDETVGAADLVPVDGDVEGDADSDAEAASEGEFREAEGLEPAETEDQAYGRLIDEATERLRDRDRFGDVLDRPISAFVDHVCRDLGLAPDWRRLAEEAWAREEIASGRVGAPLAKIQDNFPSPWMGEGPGVRVAPHRARSHTPKPPRPKNGGSIEAARFPAPAPEPEPPPPPIPALSAIQGERVPAATSPPVPPPEAGLPGEFPPLRSGHRRRAASGA